MALEDHTSRTSKKAAFVAAQNVVESKQLQIRLRAVDYYASPGAIDVSVESGVRHFA